jgi:Fe-S-cluster containining protein
MGEIIEIREQTGPSAFRIGFTVTGEERMVAIDPDKQALWSGQDIRKTRPMACPFLREAPQGAVICTVHDSRPELCRQYSCFRILVLDRNGKKIGRVMDGTRYFVTRDSGLRTIWDRECANLTIPDEPGWEEAVADRLAREGYGIVR